MIGQFIFFTLFAFTFLAGTYVYMSAKHQPLNPSSGVVMSGNDPDMTEQTKIQEIQQLHLKTIRGIAEISAQMEEMTKQQQKLIDIIDYDHQLLDHTNQNITEALNQLKAGGEPDLLKIKSLDLHLRNDQRLLVERGQALVDFNQQLNKNRQWLAQQNELLKFDSAESTRLGPQGHGELNESSVDFDKITQENNHIMQHAQDLIDQEHFKVQDKQGQP